MRSSLVFAVLLSISRPLSRCFLPANAALVNRTIDDSDTNTITYIPSDHWLPSDSGSCSGCLKPNAQLALQKTFHYGMYPVPPPHTNYSQPNWTLANGRRTNGDHPDFVDANVTASMSFTGSAFYVYCMLPVQIHDATILCKTNVTFLVDGRCVGSFIHNPQSDTGSTPGFQYQFPVFSKDDLPYGPHALEIKPQIGSTILLDFIQYSTFDTISATNGTVDGNATLAPGPVGSQVMNSAGNSNKKNTVTFGVAIGSSFGVLVLLGLGVFISIYRRRRKSAARAERERRLETREAPDCPSGPEMRAVQPFIPRHFPGVVVPQSWPSPHLIPESSSDSGIEEPGPSHGLDDPTAPEHTKVPAYSPPSLVLSCQMDDCRLPSSSLLSPAADESIPPRYQDVGQTPIVSIPVFIQVGSPPDMTEQPLPIREIGESSTSTITTTLFPKRPACTSGGGERSSAW